MVRERTARLLKRQETVRDCPIRKLLDVFCGPVLTVETSGRTNEELAKQSLSLVFVEGLPYVSKEPASLGFAVIVPQHVIVIEYVFKSFVSGKQIRMFQPIAD